MRRATPGRIIAGGLALLVAVVVIALWATGSLRGAPDAMPTTDGSGPVAESTVSPQDSANAFLEDWVDDDGRVVRRDQGDDTVSEGQAYGLLIAAGAGDEETFDHDKFPSSAHVGMRGTELQRCNAFLSV